MRLTRQSSPSIKRLIVTGLGRGRSIRYSPLASFKLLTRDRRKTRRRSLTFCLVSKGKDSFTWINFFSVPSANLDKFWRLAKVFSPVSNLMRMGGAVLDNFCLYDPFVRLGLRRQRRRCGSRRPLWIIVQRVLMNHSPRSLGVCGALLPHPPLNLLSLSLRRSAAAFFPDKSHAQTCTTTTTTRLRVVVLVYIRWPPIAHIIRWNETPQRSKMARSSSSSSW